MLNKTNIIKTASILGILVLMLNIIYAQNSAPDSGLRVIMLDFDATKNPSGQFKAETLAKRFKHVADITVPPNSKAYRVRFDIPREKGSVTPGAYLDFKTKTFTITLSPDYESWAENNEIHRRLMAWLFCANTGRPPENEIAVRDHFITTGAAAKAAANAVRESMPLARYMPCAYALAANGYFPAVIDVTSSVQSRNSDPLAAAIESEYAELLLDACVNARFIKNGLTARLIESAFTDDSRDFHGAFVRAYLANKKRPSDDSLSLELNKELDEWFANSAKRTLNTYFSPVSTAYFEYLYNRAAQYSFTDLDGEQQTTTPEQLPDKAQNMSPETLDEAIREFSARFNLLSLSAPYEVRSALSGIRMALPPVRTNNKDDAKKTLLKAVQNLYASIERSLAIDSALRDAEQRNFPPGTRLARTLETVRAADKRDAETIPSIQKVLAKDDHYKADETATPKEKSR